MARQHTCVFGYNSLIAQRPCAEVLFLCAQMGCILALEINELARNAFPCWFDFIYMQSKTLIFSPLNVTHKTNHPIGRCYLRK